MQNTDIMAEHFGRGERDVRTFLEMLNQKLEESVEDYHPLEYKQRMKYQELLNQITSYYDRTKI